MRIAGSIITLICGIGVLVGVFLPWASAYDPYYGWVSVSGWTLASAGGIQAYLALGGGLVMTLCALPAFIVSLATRRGKAAVVTLSIFAILAALLAAGGAIWGIADLLITGGGYGVSLGYGLYVSAGAAVLGFIFGIVTAATA